MKGIPKKKLLVGGRLGMFQGYVGGIFMYIPNSLSFRVVGEIQWSCQKNPRWSGTGENSLQKDLGPKWWFQQESHEIIDLSWRGIKQCNIANLRCSQKDQLHLFEFLRVLNVTCQIAIVGQLLRLRCAVPPVHSLTNM